MKISSAHIIPAILAFGAVFMALNEIDGWGWFLGICLIICFFQSMNIDSDALEEAKKKIEESRNKEPEE